MLTLGSSRVSARSPPGATGGSSKNSDAQSRFQFPRIRGNWYRPALGFGLSSVQTKDAGYGEGPDEFQPDEQDLVARIRHLLKTRGATKPQRVLLLQELRTRRNVAQTTIASRLGVKQPTVSKIERRDDVTLGTLRRFVEALGGNLQITAKFVDESVEIGGPAKKVAAR